MSLEEILTEYHLWLRQTAWRYSRDNATQEDLMQEGAIAIWENHGNWSPEMGVPLHTFLYNKAKWRMAQVAERGTFTGKPSQRGKNYHTSSQTEASYDMQTPEHFDWPMDEGSDPAMAYHTAEIVKAINTLPVSKRQRVYEVFWRDETIGPSGAWWSAKRHGARDRLRPQLEHLRDLVK